MVWMALDHVRDFVGPSSGFPERLPDPGLPLFFTRWITHFCAPVFVFLAGVGAALHAERHPTHDVSRFLLTRGAWLIVLEFLVVNVCMSFSLPLDFLVFQVIWVIGASMLVLALLVRVPRPWIVVLGLLLVAGHNLLDGWSYEQAVEATPPRDITNAQALWGLIHVGNVVFFRLGRVFVLSYPLIPWVAVMALGFALGPVFRWPGPRRDTLLVAIGGAATLLFVLLRLSGAYGDPHPFARGDDPAHTLLSFLNTEKYPPSLHYLLMTLGPSLCLLPLLERLRGPTSRYLVTLGRVPLFFYLLHFCCANLAGGIYYQTVHGISRWQDSLFQPAAAGVESDLRVVYATWIAVLVVTYPLCLWFGRYKRRHRDRRWLSYL